MAKTIIWKAMWHMTRWGCLAGIGLGGLYGTLLYPVIGTLSGMLFGGIVGIPLGYINGVVVGIVTYRFFFPLARSGLFRRTLAVISGLITLAGAFLGFSVLFSDPFYGLPNNPILVVIPTFISTGCTVYASSRFADRCLHNNKTV